MTAYALKVIIIKRRFLCLTVAACGAENALHESQLSLMMVTIAGEVEEKKRVLRQVGRKSVSR